MDDLRLRSAITAAADDAAATPEEAFDQPVASCPGWTVTELLSHLGRTQRWVALALGTSPGEPIPRPPRRPEGESPTQWLRLSTRIVLDAFDGVDLTDPVTTWAGVQDGRWWLRRMAHETSLHAWDARMARGSVTTGIPADLALDGVQEVLDVFLPLRFDWDAFGPAGETMHLHATDVDGEWLVRFQPDGAVEVRREHAKGDVAVRGPASELLLTLWNRGDGTGVEVLGDAAVLERYRAAARY